MKISKLSTMDIIYKQEEDRWIKGDRFVRPIIRRIIRKKTHYSGMERVVANFMLGLQKKKINYHFNRVGLLIDKKKPVISFGMGEKGLVSLKKSQPLIAAIGFPYPSEIPDLCERFNVKKYLQHSPWVLNLGLESGLYPRNIFQTWPAGIDTEKWTDLNAAKKDIDFLIYVKLYWKDRDYKKELLNPIIKHFEENKTTFHIIEYGKYLAEDYQKLLSRSKSMIFLSAHESQGFAYLEALASNVSVFAWDPGEWLDPVRFKYNKPYVKATSVPFFDNRCGMTFSTIQEFFEKILQHKENINEGNYRPRDYILENLTIEESTNQMMEIYNSL